ncbi:MAG: hypothetical protein ACLFVO_04825 [Chloroflexaceae bacterium]
MQRVRRLLNLGLLGMFLVTLVACGSEPVAFADIPLHPAATPLQAGSNPLADSVGNSFREAVSQEDVQVDVQLYALPVDINWEEVKVFYEEQIAGDWEADARLTQDTEAFKTIGWSRGGFVGEQGLAIGYGPPLLGNAPYLMVALFSE